MYSKLIFVSAVLVGLASASLVNAQVIAQPYYPQPTAYCPQLSYNLYAGVSDTRTAGQVTQLQQFLAARYSQPVTGYFGPLTQANVARFQTEQGIYPVTGGVGPLTRAAIARVCGGIVGNPSSQYFYPNQSFTLWPTGSASYFQGGLTVTLNSISNTNSWYPWNTSNAHVTLSYSCPPGIYCMSLWAPTQQVDLTQGQSTTFQGFTILLTSLNSSSATFVVTQQNTTNSQPIVGSISPSQAAVGTQVMIAGSNFTPTNNTVHFGFGVIQNLYSYDGTHITFTVPEYLTPSCYYSNPRCMIATQQTTPGNYAVYVENANGQSTSLNFVVTSGSQNNTITITSPNGSQTLSRGQNLAIAWTLNNAPNNSAVVLDLYTANAIKVGTIAVSGSGSASNSFNWTIPTPNVVCTMQYPNGLCGANLSGQYYVKATLVSGNGFDSNATVYASATSGVFSIY
jgi:peptidoglycan hydrolase-like protein with peptidoglycan-binding domain